MTAQTISNLPLSYASLGRISIHHESYNEKTGHYDLVSSPFPSVAQGEHQSHYGEVCSPVVTALAIHFANAFYYYFGWSSKDGFKSAGGWNAAHDFDRKRAAERLADMTGIAEHAARNILLRVAALQSGGTAFGYNHENHPEGRGGSTSGVVWNIDHVRFPDIKGIPWYQGTGNCIDYYAILDPEESRWYAWQAARCFCHLHEGQDQVIRWWLGHRRGEQFYSSALLDKAEKKFFGQIMTCGTHPKRLRFWRFVLLRFAGKTPRDIAEMEKQRGIPHRVWWTTTYK